MHIFFSVGEPSGDQHAAHLIAELKRRRPELTFSGYGGPLMEQSGCRLHYRLTDLAVMGFLQVVPLFWKFYRLVRQAARLFEAERPDAVVLVDFPGFNWWIARKAKAAGIPVFYYLPPQLWAWAPWRIRRVRKFVDHVLCGLSFEQKWYAERGVPAEYVGHPFFDEVAEHRLDQAFLEKWSDARQPIIGILPGSRNHEVARNWPFMLQVIRRLHALHPTARFLVACYKPAHREFCWEHFKSQALSLPVHLFVGKTPEIIQQSRFCLMVSGSVSLEMLARRTPAVVIYCCSHGLYWAARLLLTVKTGSLPNLMSGTYVLPEFPIAGKGRQEVEQVTDILNGWLTEPALLQLSRDQLTEIHRKYVRTGATATAAEAILARLPATPVAKAA